MLQGSILYDGRPSAFSDYFYIATLPISIDNTEMVSQKESRHLLYSAEGNVMCSHVGLLYTSQIQNRPFTCALRNSCSENLTKLSGKSLYWSTSLVKLQAFISY